MAEKVIILGSGPAGWASAIYASRAALEPLVFEGAITFENQMSGTLPLGQLALTTEVENYPGFPLGDLEAYLDSSIDEKQRKMMAPHAKEGVSGTELMELMRQQAKNSGARVTTRDIVSVDFSGDPAAGKPFVLTDSDGQTHEAFSVIVATGARANYLGMESEETYRNNGVSACAVCDGALPRFRNSPLAVIGGGDSAVEEADYLSKFASTVYLIHRRDELRASKVMAKRAMDNPKIEILWNRIPDEILGNESDGVTAIRLKSTAGEDNIEPTVSGVFLAIGHTPNTAFLGDSLKLTAKKYIEWTQPGRSMTSVEGIFAAGDVADDYYRQAVTAAGSGCMAALDCERWLAAKGL